MQWLKNVNNNIIQWWPHLDDLIQSWHYIKLLYNKFNTFYSTLKCSHIDFLIYNEFFKSLQKNHISFLSTEFQFSCEICLSDFVILCGLTFQLQLSDIRFVSSLRVLQLFFGVGHYNSIKVRKNNFIFNSDFQDVMGWVPFHSLFNWLNYNFMRFINNSIRFKNILVKQIQLISSEM